MSHIVKGTHCIQRCLLLKILVKTITAMKKLDIFFMLPLFFKAWAKNDKDACYREQVDKRGTQFSVQICQIHNLTSRRAVHHLTSRTQTVEAIAMNIPQQEGLWTCGLGKSSHRQLNIPFMGLRDHLTISSGSGMQLLCMVETIHEDGRFEELMQRFERMSNGLV